MKPESTIRTQVSNIMNKTDYIEEWLDAIEQVRVCDSHLRELYSKLDRKLSIEYEGPKLHGQTITTCLLEDYENLKQFWLSDETIKKSFTNPLTKEYSKPYYTSKIVSRNETFVQIASALVCQYFLSKQSIDELGVYQLKLTGYPLESLKLIQDYLLFRRFKLYDFITDPKFNGLINVYLCLGDYINNQKEKWLAYCNRNYVPERLQTLFMSYVDNKEEDRITKAINRVDGAMEIFETCSLWIDRRLSEKFAKPGLYDLSIDKEELKDYEKLKQLWLSDEAIQIAYYNTTFEFYRHNYETKIKERDEKFEKVAEVLVCQHILFQQVLHRDNIHRVELFGYPSHVLSSIKQYLLFRRFVISSQTTDTELWTYLSNENYEQQRQEDWLRHCCEKCLVERLKNDYYSAFSKEETKVSKDVALLDTKKDQRETLTKVLEENGFLFRDLERKKRFMLFIEENDPFQERELSDTKKLKNLDRYHCFSMDQSENGKPFECDWYQNNSSLYCYYCEQKVSGGDGSKTVWDNHAKACKNYLYIKSRAWMFFTNRVFTTNYHCSCDFCFVSVKKNEQLNEHFALGYCNHKFKTYYDKCLQCGNDKVLHSETTRWWCHACSKEFSVFKTKYPSIVKSMLEDLRTQGKNNGDSFILL